MLFHPGAPTHISKTNVAFRVLTPALLASFLNMYLVPRTLLGQGVLFESGLCCLAGGR